MIKILAFFEKQAFGVCSALGEKLGIASSAVRMFFVYASFLTFGSPLVIYLFLAFLVNIHKYLRRKRSTIWDF
ncbi:PspC domain-containing protein [Sporocytophaga myxococcoides]|uniref:PspC domain-containing protein n=1 Tax=Sporocytophaga myxococcoides TaxID=153721 RepID=UPI0004192D06|nr:PspC domain-containing protein [Sporocytophaga myxococcoides]